MSFLKYIGRLHILILILLFVMPSALQAQRSGKVQVKFACTSLDSSLSKLAYRPGKSSRASFEELQLRLNYLSDPIVLRLSDTRRVNLYDPSNLPAKDQPVSPVASFKVPNKVKTLIVLLTPVQKNGILKYSTKVIEPIEEFKYGSSCIVNLTDSSIYLSDKEKARPKRIAKGKNSLIGIGLKSSRVILSAAPEKGKEIRHFYSASWSFNPSLREICLVYKKPGKKWPSTKVIAELRRKDS